MKDLTLATLWADVQATGVAEWLAVVTGVIYILLIMRRQRAAWIMGGISSAILAVLAAQSRLPMQAALQVFYVLAAVYGWWRWAPEVQPQRVGTWSWRGHLLTLLVCVVVSVGLAHLLAREGVSAYPFLDSLLATTGLFATWLVARVYRRLAVLDRDRRGFALPLSVAGAGDDRAAVRDLSGDRGAGFAQLVEGISARCLKR